MLKRLQVAKTGSVARRKRLRRERGGTRNREEDHRVVDRLLRSKTEEDQDRQGADSKNLVQLKS